MTDFRNGRADTNENQRFNLKKAITIGKKKFSGSVKYRSRFFLIFRAAQVLLNVFEKFFQKILTVRLHMR